MGVTLNKDGTPRKIGSGKTKGAGCYAKITLKELRKLITDDKEVSVNRVWLRKIMEKSNAKDIAMGLKAPEVKQKHRVQASDLWAKLYTTRAASKPYPCHSTAA